ncbi:hypothetical protein CAI21_11765 [Alkalilimnicola ehrlichii]|uniref:Flagellar hook-length control protein-like C-terminal domain-containing protein n=1 Tax=Alkalilimnicola ehrlichii TaxID=351052 RepID=A0A3E0WU74_9GAMM|nr:flagellar hook-length control protein FliK [Alkalilimnicola ehrlichii]RFA28539.1 hypothetical protein CAI21_11765 [Alkalilimnicola ehrlichii]RFA35701.1 hypothetical protein CAL65_12285 [Alkalilimnicola ehrlichii]
MLDELGEQLIAKLPPNVLAQLPENVLARLQNAAMPTEGREVVGLVGGGRASGLSGGTANDDGKPTPAANGPQTNLGDRLWAELGNLGVLGKLMNPTPGVSDGFEAPKPEMLGARPQGLTEAALLNQLQARLNTVQGEGALRAVTANADATQRVEGETAAGLLAEAGMRQSTTQQRTVAGIPTYSVQTPVNQPGWGQAMGERLTWMVRNGIQQARIRLDPPSLGPMEIAIAVKDEKTTIQIQTHNAQAREALEAEMPRLRSMLEEGGFASVDVGVSQQQAGQDNSPENSLFARMLKGADEEEVADDAVEANIPPRQLGLVDQYA